MLKEITFLCSVLVLHIHVASEKYNEEDVGEPLNLTPLIEQNKIGEAQAAAKVSLDGAKNLVSYSGYLTVNEYLDSKLFFWFFCSKSAYKTDPLILWLQGGPGSSSLIGLFVEHGPFQITDKIELQLRNISWINQHSVLYIDNPVGTGFSYTNYGFARGQSDIRNQLYIALLQFFKMFPELQKNDFFIAGESYAGRYVLNIGDQIMNSDNSANLKKNLKGLIIGDGFVDPINQLKYGDFLYDHGFINKYQQNEFHKDEKEIVKLIKENRHKEALKIRNQMSLNYHKFSGLENFNDYVHNSQMLSKLIENMEKYINQTSTRRALHVGKIEFSDYKFVLKYLKRDRTKSVAYLIPNLLSNYRLLIYTGQLDVIVNYMAVTNYLEHLKLKTRNAYKKASRRPWYVEENVAGYVKITGNLTDVMVRNAGHLVPLDQPLWALDMITKFIRKQKLSRD